LEQLAWLMDRAFRVPGTPIRVGLDAILGILPVGGDFLTGLIQTWIVLVAMYRYRVPRAVAMHMAANVLIDTVVGAIPFLGDLFDVFFKANTRNIQLLNQVRDQYQHGEPVSTGPSILFLVGIAVLLASLLALILIGFIAVVAWLIHVAR
jgi:hypothetical protein